MAGYIDIHESFADRPDVLAAGPLAGLLWVSGVAWCNRHSPALFIPGDRLGEVSPIARPRCHARRLVEVGLWQDEVQASADGFRVVDNGLFRLRGDQCERRRMTKALRKQILERDGHRCRLCDAESPLHIDHVLPISRGGRSLPSNLQVLCEHCNLTKGAKTT